MPWLQRLLTLLFPPTPPPLCILILVPGFFSSPRFLSYQTARPPHVLISACQQISHVLGRVSFPKSPGSPQNTPPWWVASPLLVAEGRLTAEPCQRDVQRCQGSNARLTRTQVKPCIGTALHPVLENQKKIHLLLNNLTSYPVFSPGFMIMI